MPEEIESLGTILMKIWYRSGWLLAVVFGLWLLSGALELLRVNGVAAGTGRELHAAAVILFGTAIVTMMFAALNFMLIEFDFMPRFFRVRDEG